LLRNTLSGSGPHDFVQDRTHDGRIFRTLNIIDEFTKEALVIRVNRRLDSTDVVDALTDLFIGGTGLKIFGKGEWVQNGHMRFPEWNCHCSQ
jgi:hypothetical protein